jgi:hypothetical protein
MERSRAGGPPESRPGVGCLIRRELRQGRKWLLSIISILSPFQGSTYSLTSTPARTPGVTLCRHSGADDPRAHFATELARHAARVGSGQRKFDYRVNSVRAMQNQGRGTRGLHGLADEGPIRPFSSSIVIRRFAGTAEKDCTFPPSHWTSISACVADPRPKCRRSSLAE